jgi:Ca-activated chloride channel family protein
MNLLGPVGGTTFLYITLGVTALAIGAYIIKMRRRRFEVPFSHLWKRVLEQKDSNSLWKQLKRLLSLLLMLLILGLVLFAALDPTLGSVDREARNVVILIDASASMKTMDGDEEGKTSRMEAAKKKAAELIDSMGGGDLAMVMKVDGQATPLYRFTSDGPMLKKVIFGSNDDSLTENEKDPLKKLAAQQRDTSRVIEGIQASDTPADLTRALGAAADALRDRPNPLIVLISDGAYPEAQLGLVSWDASNPVPAPVKIGPKSGTGQWDAKNLATVDLSKIDVRYVPVGKRSDNVGIVSFNVRRYIANKAAYEVYIEVQNFGSEPAHRTLALYNGRTQVDSKKLDLAPGQRIKQIYSKLPASAESQLRASLRPVEGAGGADAFELDDTAYALLPQRKKQKVLMVTNDNLFLEAALLVLDDDIIPTKMTPAQYDADPRVADKVDVVIFDEHTPAELPPPPTSLLFFHPTGDNSPFKIRGEVSGPRITEIDEGHPIMRWVTMSDVYTDKSAIFTLDNKRGESAVAYFVRDAMIATKRESRRKIVAFGFSLPSEGRESATDLPMRVAFPMLLVNTLDWFAGDTTDLLTTYPTGKRERIPLDGVVGATDAEITGPDLVVTKAPVLEGLATFYGSKVGFYEVAAKNPAGSTLATIQLAANLASANESDIAPSVELSLGGKKIEAPEKFAISHSRKIWIYLLFLAMALIVMEWVTYHRRITV